MLRKAVRERLKESPVTYWNILKAHGEDTYRNILSAPGNRKDLNEIIAPISLNPEYCRQMPNHLTVIILLDDGSLMYKACGKDYTDDIYFKFENSILLENDNPFVFRHKFGNQTGLIFQNDFPVYLIRSVMTFILLKERTGNLNSKKIVRYGSNRIGTMSMIDIEMLELTNIKQTLTHACSDIK